MNPTLALFLLLLSPIALASDDPAPIDGDDAKYLFEMAVDNSNPADLDKVEFLGGCFFALKDLTLTRLYCEFSQGRLSSPDRFIKIVQPHITFAPFPGEDDPENDVEGRALGVEYKCRRTKIRQKRGVQVKYHCDVKDHFYRPRE